MPEPRPELLVQGLAHQHPGGPAIHFPDLQAGAGRPLLLRGASGSGKSTLLALLAGLLRPQAGRLEVAGANLASLPRAQVDTWRGARLGLLPQRLHLAPQLSVQHNLALAYVAAGLAVDQARIAELLVRLGLAGLAARRPGTLSHGQAQRVALARALLRRPAVLLADEPTASLDDGHAAQAMALLAEAAAEPGTACLLVVATHDSRAVAALPGAQLVHLQGVAA